MFMMIYHYNDNGDAYYDDDADDDDDYEQMCTQNPPQQFDPSFALTGLCLTATPSLHAYHHHDNDDDDDYHQVEDEFDHGEDLEYFDPSFIKERKGIGALQKHY